eukprot:snap_masked-scaffold489_size157649-processed-gene-0.2 protein:Tk05281 transcript:snap_masked-scaffold489_size157649-processed-gene-0.2-mRNA-1 annotation:"-like homeobox"
MNLGRRVSVIKVDGDESGRDDESRAKVRASRLNFGIDALLGHRSESFGHPTYTSESGSFRSATVEPYAKPQSLSPLSFSEGLSMPFPLRPLPQPHPPNYPPFSVAPSLLSGLYSVPHTFPHSALISSHHRFAPELFPAFHRHPYAMLHPHLTGVGKRKKSWTRAVFSNLQRKGLEKRFQMQKYITKPDRRQLAASLGLTDAQVKVWFQNRRMKWRHQESKERREHERQAAAAASQATSSSPAATRPLPDVQTSPASVAESSTDFRPESEEYYLHTALTSPETSDDEDEAKTRLSHPLLTSSLSRGHIMTMMKADSTVEKPTRRVTPDLDIQVD